MTSPDDTSPSTSVQQLIARAQGMIAARVNSKVIQALNDACGELAAPGAETIPHGPPLELIEALRGARGTLQPVVLHVGPHTVKVAIHAIGRRDAVRESAVWQCICDRVSREAAA